MLMIPLATTRRVVPARMFRKYGATPRPKPPESQRAPYPSSSSSVATSAAVSPRSYQPQLPQIPTSPMSIRVNLRRPDLSGQAVLTYRV